MADATIFVKVGESSLSSVCPPTRLYRLYRLRSIPATDPRGRRYLPVVRAGGPSIPAIRRHGRRYLRVAATPATPELEPRSMARTSDCRPSPPYVDADPPLPQGQLIQPRHRHAGTDSGNWTWAWSPQAGRWVWVKVPGEGEAGPKTLK